MDFAHSQRALEMQSRLQEFMDERVYPAEATYAEQRRAGGLHDLPPVIEELKAEARERGLWNLFLPDEQYGAGLRARLRADRRADRPVGRDRARGDELRGAGHRQHGTARDVRHRRAGEQWLEPLLDGEIRSCFSMTEPAVASSDATNIATTITRDGDDTSSTGASGGRPARCGPSARSRS